MLSAGTGPVFLVRWYWRRVNAASEISAMVASLVCSLILTQWKLPQEIRLCLVAALTTIVWVVVTLLTAPASNEKIAAFEARVKPGHWKMREMFVFAGGVVLVYSAFFAIGEILRARYAAAGINAAIAAFSGICVAWLLSRRSAVN